MMNSVHAPYIESLMCANFSQVASELACAAEILAQALS